MSPITVRGYQASDFDAIVTLFKEAVAAINIKHYTAEQVATWTTINLERWQNSLAANITLVAVLRDPCNDAPSSLHQEALADRQDERIVGFGDLTHEGYLDRLYVHKDYQARFVALKIFKALEQKAKELCLEKITTDCSITAKLPAERVGLKLSKSRLLKNMA